MNKDTKERCQTLRKLRQPGTYNYSGNLTEQDAAKQVYLFALLYYFKFKLKSDEDMAMFHLQFVLTGSAPLSFANGVLLWEKLLQDSQNKTASPELLQSSLYEAILRDKGA